MQAFDAANAALGFSAGAVSGTGNVARIRAVTAAEVKTVVEAAAIGVVVEPDVGGAIDLRTVATGAAASIQARAATASVFGLDTTLHTGSEAGPANAIRVEGKDPGAYANRLEAEVRAPTSAEAGLFDLAVIEDGVYREAFPNLSPDPDHERYIETVVNDPRSGSSLVRVIDQLLTNHPEPAVQTVGLAGGDDGLTGLDDNDFVGSPTTPITAASTTVFTSGAVTARMRATLPVPDTAPTGKPYAVLAAFSQKNDYTCQRKLDQKI